MADDGEHMRVEKSIAKGKLQQLVKNINATNSRIAEERGAIGQKITAAAEKDNLDKFALAIAVRLSRMNDPGRVSRHLRNIELYADHLELGGQLDIEDAIEVENEDEADIVDEVLETSGNGEERTVEVDGFDQGAPTPQVVLAKFRDAISDVGLERQVRKALANFVKDYTALAGEAEEIAAERIARIAAVDSKPKRRTTAKAAEVPPAAEFGTQVH